MSETISSLGLQLLIFILIGFTFFFVENRILSKRSRESGSKVTTTGDLARLVNDLNKTSSELDRILAEVLHGAKDRVEAATKLQVEIQRLEQAEEEYLIRIETLKNEPIRVISDLLNELQPNQIRTPRRDFMLFLAGGVASAIGSLVMDLLVWVP